MTKTNRRYLGPAVHWFDLYPPEMGDALVNELISRKIVWQEIGDNGDSVTFAAETTHRILQEIAIKIGAEVDTSPYVNHDQETYL